MTYESLAALPKVILHDHLDGGLRPRTVVELARDCGYRELPTADPDDLATWFHQGKSGSLERYLEAFAHTVAVMQTPEALERTAVEAIEDLAADGVVYAEIRFAPSLHLQRGLSRSEVIEAVVRGIRAGARQQGIDAAVIVDAMRQESDSDDVVAAALEFTGDGVVGFDLAGPEAGFPPTLHLDACRRALEGGLHLTIHAGEGAGPASIASALDPCGAERLGHGVRVVEDLELSDAGEAVAMGPVAARVHRDRVPLEVCPTSNLHTKAFPDMSRHPIGVLHRSGFVVTLNTDNRLMSRIVPTDELAATADAHGFTVADFRQIAMQAVDAAFCDEATRSRVRRRVEAGYPPV